MRQKQVLPSLCLALGLLTSSAQAQTQTAPPPDGWFDAAMLHWGRGVDLNLLEIPEAILRNDWKEERSYFLGLSLSKTVNTLGGSIGALQDTFLADVRHGYEVILLKHRGRQTNAELGAAYVLRTPDLAIAQLRVNFAAGAGLSHAFGEPTYEDGPRDDPERRYRTQLLALFEFEWGLSTLPDWSLVTRVHHRSGVFGVIAPRHVGSNFWAAGLRYRF